MTSLQRIPTRHESGIEHTDSESSTDKATGRGFMYNSNSDICIAGAVAAIIVDFAVYPFDTLKTRVQAPDYEKLYRNPRTGTLKRNVLFKGLYQGVWSVVFSTIPASGAFFMTYEGVKHALNNNNNHHAPASSSSSPISRTAALIHSLPNPIMHAIASSSAEIVSCLMLTPAEVLKQNAQVIDNSTSNSSSSSSRGALRSVMSRFRKRPWRLWSGYTALVGRNLPFTGLQFPIFEYLRGRAVEWRRERDAQTAAAGAAAGSWDPVVERASLTGLSAVVSGTIASIVTTPIDVIKTRMMLAASDGSGRAEARTQTERKKGTVTVGKEIFRDEGVKGLFRGGLIKAGWTAASLAMYLSIYEGNRFYLENRRKRRDGMSVNSEGA